jgi:hypothetical protein
MQTWKPFAVALLLGAGALAAFQGCGSDEAVITSPDASTDAGPNECKLVGSGCGTSAECCTAQCDQTTKICVAPLQQCKQAGTACASSTECCSVVCTNGACGAKQCISDNLACATDGECCGAKCAAGGDAGGKTCVPLNPNCRTAGNTCSTHGECCSKTCRNGICQGAPSFCTQLGDICGSDFECCTGFCQKQSGAAVGICGTVNAPGATGCTVAGQLCGAGAGGDGGVIVTDSGVPQCGGECCSRACAQYGPTGVLVCQPPSGCRPTGEICRTDNDCCGGPNQPNSQQNVVCAKASPSQVVGRCDNGQACRAAGQVCKLSTTSCNAENNCCAGNVNQNPTVCQQDILGIPRCTINGQACDGGSRAGQVCATSADCCGLPCVPNPSGNPPLVCGSTPCVPTAGACTTSADCCSGSPCIIAPGATAGVCGGSVTSDGGIIVVDSGGTSSDGGKPCSYVGQQCETSADCCFASLQCNATTKRCEAKIF